MRDLKPTSVSFEIDEHERGLILTLNVIDDIQEHYGKSLKDVCALLGNETERYKAVRYMLFVMLREDAEIRNEQSEVKIPILSEREIGRRLSLDTTAKAITAISNAIVASSPKVCVDAETAEMDAEKN